MALKVITDPLEQCCCLYCLYPSLGIASSFPLRTPLEDLCWSDARNWPNCGQNLHTLITASHDYSFIGYMLHLQALALIWSQIHLLSLASVISVTTVRAPLAGCNFAPHQPCGQQNSMDELRISSQTLNMNNCLVL